MRKIKSSEARKIIADIIIQAGLAVGSHDINRVTDWRDNPYRGSLNLEYNPHGLWAVGVTLNVHVDLSTRVPDGVGVSTSGTERSVASTNVLLRGLTLANYVASQVEALLQGVEVAPDSE